MKCTPTPVTDTLGRPAHVAIIKGFLRPIVRWRVDPASARFQNMNDPADDPAIIDAGLAAGIGWKMWRNLRKLPVRKPKMVPIHRCFLSEAVNHIALAMPTILWVSTLRLLIFFCEF
jgi:hypothetical protein